MTTMYRDAREALRARLSDPARCPAGMVPVRCSTCAEFIAYVNPPAPPCTVLCRGCK